MYRGQYPGRSTPRVLAMLKLGSGYGDDPDLHSQMTTAGYFMPEMKKQNFIAGYF